MYPDKSIKDATGQYPEKKRWSVPEYQNFRVRETSMNKIIIIIAIKVTLVFTLFSMSVNSGNAIEVNARESIPRLEREESQLVHRNEDLIQKLLEEDCRVHTDCFNSLEITDINFLRKALSEKRYQQKWSEIGFLLAYVSDNEVDSQAIIDYITRWDDLGSEIAEPLLFYYNKLNVTSALGFMDNKLAIDFLLKATEMETAKELFKWQDKKINDFVTALPLIEFQETFMGYAYLGLAISGKPECRKLIESHLLATRGDPARLLQDVGILLRPHVYLMIEALGVSDLIADAGVNEFYRLYQSNNYEYNEKIGKYTIKYEISFEEREALRKSSSIDYSN